MELVALPLLNAVNENIDIILARDPLFLGANTKQGTRVIRVFDQNSTQPSSEIVEALKAPTGNEQTVKIETHKKFDK